MCEAASRIKQEGQHPGAPLGQAVPPPHAAPLGHQKGRQRKEASATGPATQAVHRLTGTLEMTQRVNEDPRPRPQPAARGSRSWSPLRPRTVPAEWPPGGAGEAWRGLLCVTVTVTERGAAPWPAARLRGPSRLETAPGRCHATLRSARRSARAPPLLWARHAADGTRTLARDSRSRLRNRGKIAFTQFGDTFH